MQNISSLLTVILLNVLYYVVQNGYIGSNYRIGRLTYRKQNGDKEISLCSAVAIRQKCCESTI